MDEEPVPVGQAVEVVDPDVRAHVYSLVTALGGFNGEEADKYALGDDALACLRDIRRWLRLYDEKYNRMDVARCLGEANLVNGDLIPIISLWWNGNQQSKYMSRIALACMELLVPLTWPMEVQAEMEANHLRHLPYLQHVQVSYKRGLLSPGSSTLLRAVIRIALPSMAISRSERITRDEGILKLMLYLIRNIVVISSDTRLAAEGDEEETSRSATINAFQAQDVFALLLTMCSNVGDDFNMQDIVLMEILFHLVKGVDVEKLFSDDQQGGKHKTDLGELLRKESALQAEISKNAPSRHSRFGTMIWIKRDDAKMSTVLGQDVLKNEGAALLKMDQSKKWNKPKQRQKQEPSAMNNDFNMPTHLNAKATQNLRTFVEEFLDSGFNFLFTHVRKAIEREADRVVEINARQFFYTVSWFLKAERMRRQRQREKQSEKGKKPVQELEPDSFGLIASVLNQETFVFLNRYMQYSFDGKDWEDLNAEMRCFTQILLTVQEMSLSPLEEDQEIAENIQNRIFYEETTHDRLLAIVRGYKDQGFGYLDACTELSHVFLRMLEHYSKENADMQVRSLRRKRKTKEHEQAAEPANDEAHDSEEEDILEAERTSRERKFDFKRFAAKFCTQKCVDTFVAFTKYYRELNAEQLKRAQRYFYRIAFKQDMSVLLFRVDIIHLFYRMIKGPGQMDSSKPVFKEWEELVRHLLKRLFKKLDQRPALVTEMLFSKINSTVYYLEYGHEKQTLPGVKRAPAELEVNPADATTEEDKIKVVIGALVIDRKADLVSWVSEVLGSAADEREAFETQEAELDGTFRTSRAPNPMIAVKPRDDECKHDMFYNAKLRLLMTLVKFERLGVEDILGASWVVPAQLSSKDVRDLKSTVDKCLETPFVGNIDRDPEQMLRRKYGNESKANLEQTTLNVHFGEDSEGEDTPDFQFPPNPRSKANALDELKKKRKKRKNTDGEPVDEQTLEERRLARMENSRARVAKIKSDLFVHDSDEESDEEADKEFFRLEEERRKEQSDKIRRALLLGRAEDVAQQVGKKSRRKRASDQHLDNSASQSKRQRRKQQTEEEEEEEEEEEDDDIVMGNSGPGSTGSLEELAPSLGSDDDLNFDDDLPFRRNQKTTSAVDGPLELEGPPGASTAARNEDEDEDAPVAAPNRRRMRAGFVIDSDSE